jgi:hypothetical protein
MYLQGVMDDGIRLMDRADGWRRRIYGDIVRNQYTNKLNGMETDAR